MKQKVSDYIADRLAQEGICQVFTVTGGGAMHLNDSLGHHPGLSCLYQHHEQAAAMAAEAYARVDNRMAAVCVTSGPGATNAITGALCAWMDSIPMIVLSGQVRYDTTVRHSGLKIRTMGVQEYDITPSVKPMTKYAVMVTDPLTIRYHLERAIYLAKTGRPGPFYLWGMNIGGYKFTAIILGCSLNYAAYFAEIYRSGIESIPTGQYEAAQLLGYTRVQTFFKIVLPQVVKIVLPSVTNEVITLVKDTSLVYSVSYIEMFAVAKQIAAAQTTVVPFFIAGIFYYVFNYVVAWVMELFEKKLNYYR